MAASSIGSIVDAHHHFWDIERNYLPWLCDEPAVPFRYGDYTDIRRNYLPSHYLADAQGFDVAATVYVETEWDPTDPVGETRWIHEIAAEHGYPNAVVAQAWLDRDDVADVLAAQAAFPLTRSVRHKPPPGVMATDRWRKGYALLEAHGLSFDLQTPWVNFKNAAALARDFPGVRIILNHAGMPADRSEAGLAGWAQAMRTLAREPNVVVKISGIGQAGEPWTVAANRSVVLDAIEVFGVERCMFASNFPVDSLCAGYGQIFDGFDRITTDFTHAERRAMFHDNAIRVYGIDSGKS